MDILIHASPERMWYVNGYLVPKLLSTKLRVYSGGGNLDAYIKSYMNLPEDGDTWHLEDDVLPDRRFLKWAEQYKGFEGIICGFRPTDKPTLYSFPCIRIPNGYIKEFLKWFEGTKDECVRAKVESGKGIDYIFHKYWVTHKIDVLYMWPCMVEHIDYLIGGSLINERYKPLKGYNFEDNESLTELMEWLERRGYGTEKTR